MQHIDTEQPEETSFSTLLRGPWELVVAMTDEHFDIPTTAQATLVCQEWNSFFNTQHHLLTKKIQIKISEEFGIDLDILKRCTNKINTLKILYQHLTHLKKRTHLLPSFLRGFCTFASNHVSLLTCCTDNPALFFNHIFSDFYPAWEQIAITAGCNNIAKRFFVMSQDKPAFVKMAAHALNLDLLLAIQQLPDSEKMCPDLNKTIVLCAAELGDLARIKAAFQAEPLKETFSSEAEKNNLLNKSARSGNPDLLRYLLEEQEQQLEPRLNTLNFAALSGNLEAFRYVLSLVGISEVNFNTFEYAAQSDNPELMDYLIKEHPAEIEGAAEEQQDLITLAIEEKRFKMALHLLTIFVITPDQELLNKVVSSGNMECFNCLLSPRFSIKDELEKNTTQCDMLLETAARSGCLNVVRCLINTFHVLPQQETLSQAVKSGNTPLMRYLLDPKNNFQLTLIPAWFLIFPSLTLMKLLHEYKLPLIILPEQKTNLIREIIYSVKDNGDFELFYHFINPLSFFLAWNPSSHQANLSLLNTLSQCAYAFKDIHFANESDEPQKDIGGNIISRLLYSALEGYLSFTHLHHYGTSDFDETQAKEAVSNTLAYSTYHFSHVLRHIMSNPHFSSEAKQFFISVTNEILSQRTISQVERKFLSDLIKPFLPSTENTNGEKIKEETLTEKDNPSTLKLNRGPSAGRG